MDISDHRTKIAEAEWGKHKNEIIDLYLVQDLKLKAVVDRMRGRLDASLAQYEAQFKAWGLRKNLKEHEWVSVFNVIDKLPQGTQSRVVISGYPASHLKIQRARRNYKHSSPARSKRRRLKENNADKETQVTNHLQDVSIQILSNGTWSTLPTTPSSGFLDTHQKAESHHTLQRVDPLTPHGNDNNSTLLLSSSTSVMSNHQVGCLNVHNSANSTNHDELGMSTLQHTTDILSLPETCPNSDFSSRLISDFRPKRAQHNHASGSRKRRAENLVPETNDDVDQEIVASTLASSEIDNGAADTVITHEGNIDCDLSANLPFQLTDNTVDDFEVFRDRAWEQNNFPRDDPPFPYRSPSQVMGILEPLRIDALPIEAAETVSSPRCLAAATRRPSSTAHWNPQTFLKPFLIALPSNDIVGRVIQGLYSNTSTTNASIDTSMPNLSLAWQLSVDTDADLSPVSLPPALMNLLSAQAFVGEEQRRLATLPRDTAYEARVYARLIELVINSFPGSENISAASVLKFLKGHQVIQFSVTRFLHSRSNPAAISFAENLFRAALEADDMDIVEYLLDHTGFVDAHETIICNRYGARHTPLQVAALHQSLRVLGSLLSRNVDTNQSAGGPNRSNALEFLILGRNPRSTLDDRFLGLVDSFLEANTTISMSCIHHVLEKFTDHRLVVSLINKAVFQMPQQLISANILVDISQALQRQDAASMVALIIDKCLKSDGAYLLYQDTNTIDDTLHDAIRRGYKELVEILLPYTRNPVKAVQTAMETGNQGIVDLICQRDPDMKKETESAGSLIAALRIGDQNHLRLLEERGVLHRLQGCRELGQALSVALEVGNLEYATKLVDFEPGFNFYDENAWENKSTDVFDAGVALSDALTHDFDDIAWKLLDVWAMYSSTSIGRKSRNPLYVAVVKRKPHFVKAIVESGINLISFGYTSDNILRAVIEWGDDSVLNDILQSILHWGFPSLDTLKLAFEQGISNFFWDTIRFIPRHRASWRAAMFEFAIWRQDIPLLDELMPFAAKQRCDKVLSLTIKNYPSMLRPLLQHYRKAYPQGCPGYGRNDIVEAVNQYPQSSELLDILFEFGLVATEVVNQDGLGWTLLDCAIEHRNSIVDARHTHAPLIKRLIDIHIDNNIPWDLAVVDGVFGKITPLLRAIRTRRTDVVQLLIEYGAEVNRPACLGLKQTPLQAAAEMDDLDMVSLLLNHEADVNAAPAMFKGGTALQLAAIRGNLEIARVLIEHGARLDIPPPRGRFGRWPLEGAAENGRLDMIQFLWEVNDGPIDDRQCQKAMKLAEHNGHLGCKKLIEQLMANTPYTGQM